MMNISVLNEISHLSNLESKNHLKFIFGGLFFNLRLE